MIKVLSNFPGGGAVKFNLYLQIRFKLFKLWIVAFHWPRGFDFYQNDGIARFKALQFSVATSESKLADFRGKNIGIVFQFFQLVPTLIIHH